MNTIILILLSLSLISSVLIIYLNFKSKNESHNEKENQEIQRLNQEIINLKESLNTTINSTMSSMATSFNNLSSGVTKDMTNALTQVDQKVASFNAQVENLNESQKGINQILAGVKKYGTLAEFSLGSLIKDLLPASQYLSNVKANNMSGGEYKKISTLQRICNKDIKVLLLDEPMAALDPLSISSIKKFILELRDMGLSVIITDHNFFAIQDILDNCIIIRDGVVMVEGPPKRIIKDQKAIKYYLGTGFKI